MPLVFPESMKAGRFLFETTTDYAGRLLKVWERNVENDASDAVLLRLEFEIYAIRREPDERITLFPTGGISSRDLIVSSASNRSSRVKEFADLLSVKDYKRAKNWYLLNQKVDVRPGVWLTIRFGPPNTNDFRQPFEWISSFIWTDNCQVDAKKAVGQRDLFLPVSKVRAILFTRHGKHPSDVSVTNFVDKHKTQYGENLVKMAGNQRRINWYLCWHLWEADLRTKE
jgi:hypothetical protein